MKESVASALQMARPTRGSHGQVEMALPAPVGEVKKKCPLIIGSSVMNNFFFVMKVQYSSETLSNCNRLALCY